MKNNIVTILVCTLLMGSLLTVVDIPYFGPISPFVKAETTHWYVNSSFQGTSHGNETNPFKTINEAVSNEQLEGGDVIHVLPGTYTDTDMQIDEEIRIIGAGGEITLLQPPNSGFYIISDNVSISHMSIGNAGGGQEKAITIQGAYNVTLDNITIDLCDIGIDVYGSSKITIDNCSFSPNIQAGIMFSDQSDDVLIKNNIFQGAQYGIRLFNQTEDVRIINNSVPNAVEGISVQNNCSNIFLQDNNCSNNSYGLKVSGCDLMELWDNMFNDNTNAGIYIQDTDDIQIYGNQMMRCNDGIRAENSYGMAFVDNRMNDCTNRALQIIGSEGNYSDNTCESNNYGMFLEHVNTSIFLNNKCLYNSDYGMELKDSSDNYIEKLNCSYSNASHGILFTDGADHNEIYDSQFLTNVGWGIQILDSNHNTFENILVMDCNAGGVMVSGNDEGNRCIGNVIGSSVIDDNYGNNIILQNTQYCNITDCQIIDSDNTGIYLQNASGSVIYDNIVNSSRYAGIRLEGTESQNNVIYENYFNNNSWFNDERQAGDFSDDYTNLWYDANLQTGNYWSDYLNYNPNAISENGLIWSVPYQLAEDGAVLSHFDIYPLVNPKNEGPISNEITGETYNTIESALENASANDIISINIPGEYRGTDGLYLTENGIKLTGLGADNVTLIPRKGVDCIIVEAFNCTVEDLSIFGGRMGILGDGADGINVHDINFVNQSLASIRYQDVVEGNVDNCRFDNSNVAISAEDSSEVSFEDCLMLDCNSAFSIDTSHNIDILDNHMVDCVNGSHLMDECYNFSITGNRFDNMNLTPNRGLEELRDLGLLLYGSISDISISNNEFFGVGTSIITLAGGDNVRISENSILQSDYRGIVDLGNDDPIYIFNNTLDMNPIGIMINCSSSDILFNNNITHGKIGISIINNTEPLVMPGGKTLTFPNGSHDNIIKYNEFRDNEKALYISGGYDNQIYHNNFFGGDQQISIPSGLVTKVTWDHEGISGNYWNDYSGTDDGSNGRTAGDGIGDTNLPHRGIDEYPLMKPALAPEYDLGILSYQDLTSAEGWKEGDTVTFNLTVFVEEGNGKLPDMVILEYIDPEGEEGCLPMKSKSISPNSWYGEHPLGRGEGLFKYRYRSSTIYLDWARSEWFQFLVAKNPSYQSGISIQNLSVPEEIVLGDSLIINFSLNTSNDMNISEVKLLYWYNSEINKTEEDLVPDSLLINHYSHGLNPDKLGTLHYTLRVQGSSDNIIFVNGSVNVTLAPRIIFMADHTPPEATTGDLMEFKLALNNIDLLGKVTLKIWYNDEGDQDTEIHTMVLKNVSTISYTVMDAVGYFNYRYEAKDIRDNEYRSFDSKQITVSDNDAPELISDSIPSTFEVPGQLDIFVRAMDNIDEVSKVTIEYWFEDDNSKSSFDLENKNGSNEYAFSYYIDNVDKPYFHYVIILTDNVGNRYQTDVKKITLTQGGEPIDTGGGNETSDDGGDSWKIIMIVSFIIVLAIIGLIIILKRRKKDEKDLEGDEEPVDEDEKYDSEKEDSEEEEDDDDDETEWESEEELPSQQTNEYAFVSDALNGDLEKFDLQTSESQGQQVLIEGPKPNNAGPDESAALPPPGPSPKDTIDIDELPLDEYTEDLKDKLPALSLQEVPKAIKNIIPSYIITHKLGSGGFATVYKAINKDGDAVAIKMPKFLDETVDSSILNKFKAEADIWKKLHHKNIVNFLDSDIRPIPYMTIELMEGGNLAELMKEQRFSVEEAKSIMLQTLDGISYAHRMASVHRDIKPENILFTKDGTPKISDWGIGKFMASESVSKSIGTKGTFAYAAPEQFDRETYGEVDWSTDLFQLGVVFYQMLTGINPFMADELARTMGLILTTTPEKPSKLNPEVPPELDEIIMKCLEKKKEKRWRSTDVLYSKLKEMEMKKVENLKKYRRSLDRALSDGQVSPDEEIMLTELREHLNITELEHKNMMDDILG